MTKLEVLIDALCEITASYPNEGDEVRLIENKNNCSITLSVEKHNALQYTYYFDVDFKNKGTYCVEIESGINRGTVVNSAEWDCSTKPTTKYAEVLKDIILDSESYKDGSFLKMKAQAILNSNKDKLFEFHRKNQYDNYVTGGNSKLKLEHPLDKLELDYIYELEEVDVSFM